MIKPKDKNIKFHVVYITLIFILTFMLISAIQLIKDTKPTEPTEAIIEHYEKSYTDNILVHIKGEVKNPGLYEVAYDTRVYDAIEIAGGFTDNADRNSVDLAEFLEDGDSVNVKAKKSSSNSDKTYKAININSASAADFASLPGISDSLASDIVLFRSRSGGFSKTEDLMKIKGFSSNLYLSLKSYLNL